MIKINVSRILLCIFCALFGAEIYAQSLISKADKYSADSLSQLPLNQFIDLKWLSEDYFYYTERDLSGERFVYIVSTADWEKHILFDNNELARLISEIGVHVENFKLALYSIRFNPDNLEEFSFTYKSKNFIYNWKTKSLKESASSPFKSLRRDYIRSRKRYSADSLYWVSAVGNNLYLHSRTKSIRLSNDGTELNSYSIRDMSLEQKKQINYALGRWIGNTHRYILIKQDKRKLASLSLINSLASPRPLATSIPFAMPGDSLVCQYSVYLLDADKEEMRELKDLAVYKDQAYLMSSINSYTVSGHYAYLLRYNRQRNKMDLCRVDGNNGQVKIIISEDCKPHFNEFMFSYKVFNEGKDILWWSERTGYGQYYHYDGEGNLLNSTSNNPQMVASRILSIDKDKGIFIISAFGAEKGLNPDYRFYYKLSINHEFEPILLTKPDAYHSAELSPKANYLLDNYSRIDMATKHNIVDMQGNVKYVLPSTDLSLLFAKSWQYPILQTVYAADGVTRLDGIVYLPFDMKADKKYPIIANVYPGPQTDQVPREFTIDDNYNQSLAQLGFIVINFPFRGSNPNRGRDFFNYGYGNLRDYALDDCYSIIQQIAKIYPQADTTRVGIYGHSGGAFMTVAAMLQRPDFYKVGIAASGNHDNNIYSQWWGESFHGVELKKDDKGKEYFVSRIPTNIEIADKLQGRLLLITGDMDDNVNPASTYRLAKAFIDAGKDFDMLVLPGQDHGLGGAYYINKIRYYFMEHLLNIPPKNVNILN